MREWERGWKLELQLLLTEAAASPSDGIVRVRRGAGFELRRGLGSGSHVVDEIIVLVLVE